MGGLVRRGAGTGTLENRMECSKLFKASGRRPREEAGGFSWPGLWHPASGCSMFLSRFNAYTQACKRAARTFAFESCATYIPIDFLLFSSSFVFCSFPSIIVNTSFVPSRVSFFFYIPLPRESTFQLTTMIRFHKSIGIVAIFGLVEHILDSHFPPGMVPVNPASSSSSSLPPGENVRMRTFRDKSSYVGVANS